MTSLNGDVTVIRNGRSTSQVSIYNYPEHLNPFYDDDHHKRLRFWKVNKKDNEGRRNSFSIGNLKDMWAFKSFRLKKKSSTLGINKTSESPPMLRRDLALNNNNNNNGWNSFDHRLRSSNASSIDGDSFQRNTTYRTSLQNIPNNNDRIGLNRNDNYRSTIQFAGANSRYHPPRHHLLATTADQKQQQQQQTRRSSQTSVSTNPFDTDNEDDNDAVNHTMSTTSSLAGSTNTLSKRTPRKKRRAPAPPTPIHGRSPPTIQIESSQEHNNSTQDELCIREDIDIANLTAEIADFVKNTSNDDIETQLHIKETVTESRDTTASRTSPPTSPSRKTTTEIVEIHKSSSKTPPTTPTTSDVVATNKDLQSKSNGQAISETITFTTTSTDTQFPKEKDKRAIETVAKEEEQQKLEILSNGAIPKKQPNSIMFNENINNEETTQSRTRKISEQESVVGQVECIHVHVESPRAAPRHNHSGLSSFKKETSEQVTTKTPFTLTSPPSQRKHCAEKGKEVTATTESQSELKITEDDKPKVAVKPALSPKPQIHGYAEIHKPTRVKVSNAANGHVKRASRDETNAPVAPIPPRVEETKQIVETTKTNVSPATSEAVSTAQIQNQPNTVHIKNNASSETAGTLTADDVQIIETPPSYDECVGSQQRNEATLRNERSEFEASLYRSQQPTSHMEWKRSTLAPLETNIPPEKRKSVKDIIESINRSQRLLNAAANKDFTLTTSPHEDDGAMLQTIEDSTVNDSMSPSADTESNDNQKLDNEIFKKCTFKKEIQDYRETSPITSNLDWNPVPKPKRTKSPHE